MFVSEYGTFDQAMTLNIVRVLPSVQNLPVGSNAFCSRKGAGRFLRLLNEL